MWFLLACVAVAVTTSAVATAGTAMVAIPGVTSAVLERAEKQGRRGNGWS